MSMSESPTEKLVSELSYHLERRRMAYDMTWKWPGNESRIEAGQNSMAQEDLAIENRVKVWVYKDLIEKFKILSAYNDVGHFDHIGVMAVIEFLQNEVQRMTNEG